MMKMDIMAKLKKFQLDDEVKKLSDMQEVHERLRANHAMYLRCGDYAADRFMDKEITEDAMLKKIEDYDKKIKRQKNKIMKMEMDN